MKNLLCKYKLVRDINKVTPFLLVVQPLSDNFVSFMVSCSFSFFKPFEIIKKKE